MIMANSQKGSVCLICSSNIDKIDNDSNFNSEICSKFLRFVPRYLSYGHNNFNNKKIDQFLKTVKFPRFSSIKCCDICVEQLETFLEVYENLELIQLELLHILDGISTLILKSCSENKPKKISDFQVAFTNLVEEKRTKHFPVVNIKRLEELPLSVDHLKLEPFPFDDDHTDFEACNPDSNFETISQNDLPKLLENETIHSLPITWTVNIKINNHADRHDHEDEVSTSKDRRSPNHQKLGRKLLPKLTKLSVKDKISKYKCLFCSESRPSRFKLFRHLRSHTEEKPHHCKKCSKEFCERHGLKGHVIGGHHTDDDTEGNRPESVKDKPCPICGKLFSLNSSVRTHISFVHTKVRKFKCEYQNCSKAFVRKCDLDKHQLGHTGLKPFKCNICYKRFRRQVDLAIHKLSVHGDETCKKRMCSVCRKVFPGMRPLRIHRARMHPDIFKDDRESLMKLNCPRAPCDMKFLSRFDVRKHVRSKHFRFGSTE